MPTIQSKNIHLTLYHPERLTKLAFSITDVMLPYGGYDRFNDLKLGNDYLPIWMQKVCTLLWNLRIAH